MSSFASDAIETELRTGTPRSARFRTGPQLGRVLLWSFVLGLAFLICYMAVNDLTALNALLKQGKQATATVTGKHYTSGKSTSYYLNYIFEAEGQVINDEESVYSSLYHSSYIGTSLPIVYLPGRPAIHRFPPVDSQRIARATLMWSGGFLFFVGLFAAALYACEKAFRTQYRLLRFGEAVRAEITRCVPPVKGAKSQLYSIGYRYDVPMHGPQTGTASVSVKMGHWLAQRSYATVLFDPEQSRTSRLYAALNTVELTDAPRSIPRF